MLGALSDRFGRRPILIASLLGSALGFAVFGVGGALWELVLGRVLELLTAGNISALYASVADMHAPEDRAAALALLNAAWVFLRLPETHPVERRSTQLQWTQLNVVSQLAGALRDSRLRTLFAVVFCFASATTLLASNLAVLLRDLLAFQPAAIGMVLFGIGVMDIVSQGLATPRLVRRFGERRVAVAGANQAQQSIARMIAPLAGAGLYAVAHWAPYAAGATIVTIAAARLRSVYRRLDTA